MSTEKEMNFIQEETCQQCDGQGYQGTAYWDDELDWYIFGKDGKPCECCKGEGLIMVTNHPEPMALSDPF
jgi:DnaJ-class molecular chaperone